MNIPELSKEFQARLNSIQNKADLEELRNQYLGRKRGIITSLLKDLPNLQPDKKASAGKEINEFKKLVEEGIEKKEAELAAPPAEKKIDWSLPGKEYRVGAAHPLTQVRQMIEEIFREMGYAIAE